jgi:hypothetical protein
MSKPPEESIFSGIGELAIGNIGFTLPFVSYYHGFSFL